MTTLATVPTDRLERLYAHAERVWADCWNARADVLDPAYYSLREDAAVVLARELTRREAMPLIDVAEDGTLSLAPIPGDDTEDVTVYDLADYRIPAPRSRPVRDAEPFAVSDYA